VTDLAVATLQVTSFHNAPNGGGILIGGDVSGVTAEPVRALIPATVLPREPKAGEWWTLSGHWEARSIFDHRTGRDLSIDHLISRRAYPAPLRGKAVTHWIAKHPDIPGVGIGYAERLWDAFGPRLFDVLRSRDVSALAKVLDHPKAAAIIDAFGLLTDEIDALEQLDALGLDGRTAKAAITLFGNQAAQRFGENPYALTLLEPWPKVDAKALSVGVAADDDRRLAAAVDDAVSFAWRNGGHTVVDRSSLLGRVSRLLGVSGGELALRAVNRATERGDLKPVGEQMFQGRAAWHIERQIEEAISLRLRQARSPIDRATVEVVIAEIEREDRIKFEPEQRQAILLALSSGVAAIAGGAGTGKTTIIKAIMRSALRLERGDYWQVALSGRAAKRLGEATQRRALTIYRYLKDLEFNRLKIERGLLVIDEFSMVSTPDLWKLLAATPLAVDIIMVGDPGQLPPIQAGNPAAAVFGESNVPRVSLRAPHRQQAGSGIPEIASDVRAGICRLLPEFDERRPDQPGVFIAPCVADEVASRSLEVFAALAGSPSSMISKAALARLHQADIQILAMTRHLSKQLGKAIEARWMASQPAVHNWGFHVGSKILWNQNTYDHESSLNREPVDIMNGALGVIQGVTTAGAEVRFDDDTTTEIFISQLDRVLYGWAITVHKAQGSAFRRVIIPVTQSRHLDRATLYTAITRARISAVLVGEPDVIVNAIRTPPRVRLRMQALDLRFSAP
jgi:exodeoxyribonuclease V alpha subunit